MNNTIDFATTCACFNIRKAARAVTSMYETLIYPATKLHATQFTLLMVVASAKEPTISRLAEHLVMDRTTLARDLKPLQAQGLIVAAPGEDRRTRVVQLTDAGHTILDRAIPLWEQAQQQLVVDGLGHMRWSHLYDELQDVVRLAQK